MGKKAVEMGRYGASELMRNKNLQKKAVNYEINKLTPFIQDSVGSAMDELSTKVRPKKNYKTNRKDLDGGGIGGGINPTLQYAFDEAKLAGYKGNIEQFAKTTGLLNELTGGNLVYDAVKFGWNNVAKGAVNKAIQADKKRKVYEEKYKPHFENSWRAVKELGYKHDYFTFYLSLTNKPLGWTTGSGVDIHKQILKVAPRKGFVLPGHNYTGPGNPLETQLKYDPQTGEILEIYEQPTGRTDAVSMKHDVDYSVCANKPKSEQVQCKNKADRKMVKSLDAIPWKERQWGHALARTMINTKQKLGMGLNARRR